jgi:tetratricopeptide (TPR) repeat protein
LISAENNDWFVEQLLLVDPDEIDEADQIPQEIIASLEKLLELNPNNVIALYTLLPYLIDTNSDDIWEHFKQLVQLDKSSHYTRNIIDHLYELDDLKPAFDILNDQAQNSSENPASYLNLAQLAIIDENTILAQEYLEMCEKFVPQYGEGMEIEIQRLKLSVAHLDFDQQYSEIKMILDAKNIVSENDVEFLEDAIEIAPKFGDLYVTLACCYLSWKDTDDALEVLNDAQTKVGSHPRIIQTLAQVLWDTDQKALSFEQLNEGLKYYPNDVPLLTQIAGYLIDNNQLSDSKPFIERAEIIAPSHPRLWKLRKKIAEKTTQ